MISKNIGNEIIFSDAPDFRPNLTPSEIFQLDNFFAFSLFLFHAPS
jgi:hypothetical protein